MLNRNGRKALSCDTAIHAKRFSMAEALNYSNFILFTSTKAQTFYSGNTLKNAATHVSTLTQKPAHYTNNTPISTIVCVNITCTTYNLSSSYLRTIVLIARSQLSITLFQTFLIWPQFSIIYFSPLTLLYLIRTVVLAFLLLGRSYVG